MGRFLGTYGVVFLVLLVLDALWLGLVAKSFYQEAIGHLMTEHPRLGVAALFYIGYPLGVTLFAVWPHAGQPGLTTALMMGALFGLFAYGTYDLTNLATLKGWPVRMAVVDMAWGASVSAAGAVAGKWALDRWFS
jgi:uncharacterized membrane protein